MTDRQQPDAAVGKTSGSGPGFDALIEDVLGLNLRGVKTLWFLFANPNEVFTAARHENWENRFTPSIRLYFSIIAIIVFFQFIWAGEHSYMREAFLSQFETMQTLPNFGAFDVEQATDLAINIYLMVSPLVVGIFMLLTACCMFVWGKGTGFVTRIRLFFAALVPYIAVSAVLTLATSHATPEQSLLIAGLAIGSMLVINWLTAFRGLRDVHSMAARVWKSGLFSVVVMLSIMVSGTVSQLVVGVWAGLHIVNAQDPAPQMADEN